MKNNGYQSGHGIVFVRKSSININKHTHIYTPCM